MRLDVHVLPLGDLVRHEETRTCWCVPLLQPHPGGAMVTHHAADDREQLEQALAAFDAQAHALQDAAHPRQES